MLPLRKELECYQLKVKKKPSIIINENQAKVEEFKKKTSLDILKTKENAFLEIVRAAEKTLEGETGADIFRSDDSKDFEDD